MISYIDKEKEILKQVINDIPSFLACIYPNSDEDRKLQNEELNEAMVMSNKRLNKFKKELEIKLTLLNDGVQIEELTTKYQQMMFDS